MVVQPLETLSHNPASLRIRSLQIRQPSGGRADGVVGLEQLRNRVPTPGGERVLGGAPHDALMDLAVYSDGLVLDVDRDFGVRVGLDGPA